MNLAGEDLKPDRKLAAIFILLWSSMLLQISQLKVIGSMVQKYLASKNIDFFFIVEMFHFLKKFFKVYFLFIFIQMYRTGYRTQ